MISDRIVDHDTAHGDHHATQDAWVGRHVQADLFAGHFGQPFYPLRL